MKTTAHSSAAMKHSTSYEPDSFNTPHVTIGSSFNYLVESAAVVSISTDVSNFPMIPETSCQS